MSENVSKLYRRLSICAPLVTICALVVLSHVLPARAEIDDRAIERQAEIAKTMASVPFLIGGWIGADAPVPPEAQKLLRPNAMLSRTYSQINRPSVHVVVVHCSDARDMIGHYPPICYPSSGWVDMPVLENAYSGISVASTELPVRQYLYRRMGENGTEARIRIFSAFILPDGTVTRDIDDINEQSERLAVSIQGVAQLQLITDASTDYADAVTAAGELLSGMPELLTSLGVEWTPEARTVAFDFQGQGADDRVR